MKSLAILCFAFCAFFAVRQSAVAEKPNVLVIIADQWRAEAFGFAGNPDVKTPNLDKLASQSVRCVNAVSGLPVCSPMRASFLTGQRPLTDGVFMNDVLLNPQAQTIGKVFKQAGYDTGFIGKWHVNGDGRSAYIPPERRQGFDYWKVLECTHDYNHSEYYAGEDAEKRRWEGYDAFAQTRDAQNYLREHASTQQPFFLVLSWGPPHDPYFTAPEKYAKLYEAEKLAVRPNVPPPACVEARKLLAGYYAHCTALDECVGQLRRTLHDSGLEENTIVIFTSDHGDMLGSQGMNKKQKPYDESIRVPLLVHWSGGLGRREVDLTSPINSEDLMPTILGLCKLRTPKSAEGRDFSAYLKGRKAPGDGSAMISCVAPFGEWDRAHGGKEFRGLRTDRYTYCRDLSGPWLLFDDQIDPFQTNNLANDPKAASLQHSLDKALARKLKAQHDEFLPAENYLRKYGIVVNANGTVPYTH